MTLLLDAGALIALEQGDRVVWKWCELAKAAGTPPATHAGVVAQVWRGGDKRQAQLARALDGIDVAPLDDELARRTGLLLASSGTSDIVDAALIAMTDDDDRVLTSDADDLATLAAIAGRHIDVVAV